MTYSSKSNAVKDAHPDTSSGIVVLRSFITALVLFMLGLFLFFSTQQAEAQTKKTSGVGLFKTTNKKSGDGGTDGPAHFPSFIKTGKQTSCDTVQYRIRFAVDVDDPEAFNDPQFLAFVNSAGVTVKDVLPAGLSIIDASISGDVTDGGGGVPIAAIGTTVNPNDTLSYSGARFSAVDLDGDGSLTTRSFEIVINAKIDPAAFPAPSTIDNQATITLANIEQSFTFLSHDPALPDDGVPETGDPTSILIDLTDCDTPPGDGGDDPEGEPCFKVEKGEVECAKDGGGAFIYNMPVGPEMAGRSIELVSLTPGVTIAPISQIVPPGGGVLSWTITGATPGMTVSLSVVGMEIGAGPAEGWGLCCTQRIDIEIPEGIDCPPEDGGEPDLKVEKKADVGLCSIGGGCDFTITVSNVGDVPYSDEIVLDEVTSLGNATLAGPPNAPWTCAPNISPLVCSHPPTTLNPGESVELNLSFIPGDEWKWRDIKNCAEFNYGASGQPAPFGDLTNDKACASIPIAFPGDPENPKKKVDLELKKEHGGMACSPDGICYFFINISNVGTENFNGPLTVVDTFTSGAPLSAEFSPTPPWNCATIDPSQFSCVSDGNINLPVGASTKIKVVTTIDPANVKGRIVENCAVLDPVAQETNLDNQKDCAEIPVTKPEEGEPKIEIEKVCRVDDPGASSDHWTCKITVTNSGTAAPKTEISILEKLALLEGKTTPEVLIDDTKGGIACVRQGAAEFDCDLSASEFAPGTSKEITLSFSLAAGHKFENCATAYERDQGVEGGELAKSCVTGEKAKEEPQCKPPLVDIGGGRCGCPKGTTYSRGKCIEKNEPPIILPPINDPPELCKLKPGQIRTQSGACVCRKGTQLNENRSRCVPIVIPCPEDTIFDRRLKKCVPRVPQCRNGEVYDRELRKCVPEAPQCRNGEVYDRELRKCVPRVPQCREGEVYNWKLRKCVPEVPQCREGEVYNWKLRKCVPEVPQCRKGEVYDRELRKCVPEAPQCRKGEVYNWKLRKCVPEAPQCRKGEVYNWKLRKCVPEVPQCRKGEVYDRKLRKCVPEVPQCRNGEVYNPARKLCVPTEVTPCGKGKVYNRRLRRCVPEVPQCPKGQVYNPARKLCVPTEVTPCGKGKVYNRRLRRCAPQEIICRKGQIRRGNRCVDRPVVCRKGQIRRGNRCVDRPVVCRKGQIRRGNRCVDRPVVCRKGQIRRGNRCVDRPVVCRKGQIRRGNRCVDRPVVCRKGQIRRGNRCVDRPVVCRKGQIRRGNRCVDRPVVCRKGQIRRGNRCVNRPVVCRKGQIRRGNRCVNRPVVCRKGQIRRGNRCVPDPRGQATPRCRRGEVLVGGKCQRKVN